MFRSKFIGCAVLVLVVASCGFTNAESCVQCTSSEEDARCSEHPQHITPTECATGSTAGCFSRIVVGGHTVRGCAQTLLAANNCTNDPLCETCFNDIPEQACNARQFPEIRLSCHQCTGNLTSYCANTPANAATLCNLFREDNQCYIRRTNETITRGCLSSSGTSCDNREHCYICDGVGCNLLVHSDPAIPEAPSSGSIISMSVLMLLVSFVLTEWLLQ